MDLIERRLGHLRQRLFALDADAIDEDVGGPVPRSRAVDDLADVVDRSDIERHAFRLEPVGRDRAREVLRLAAIAPGDDHRRARERAPQATASPMPP